jgi:hypothetical protein
VHFRVFQQNRPEADVREKRFALCGQQKGRYRFEAVARLPLIP